MIYEGALEIITNAVQQEDMTVEQDKALALVQKALEKQIPKKRADGWYGNNTECPVCHIVASGNYCSRCGQKLEK